MEALSQKISSFAIHRGWLQDDQYEWCVYVLMKHMGTALYLMIMIAVSILFRRLAQMLVFVFVTYLLRRRIGGWHAKTPLQCQIMSIAITGLSVLVFCPMISRMVPRIAVLFISLIVAGFLFVIHPEYPEQLHFTEEIKAKNTVWKNILVGIIIIFALASYFVAPMLLPCFLTGLLVVFAGVAVEKQVMC